MIRAWLERNGWKWVGTDTQTDGDDDLYTKGSPVCMNTAAALFSELTDMEAQRNHLRSEVCRVNAALEGEIHRRMRAEKGGDAVDRCEKIAMDRCRSLNGDAVAQIRSGRPEMASLTELKADQFEWMANAIRLEFSVIDVKRLEKSQ